MSSSDSTLHDDPVAAAAPAAVSSALAVIACPEVERVGTRIPLSKEEPFLIGRRVERGGLALEDPRLSRVHARIVWDGRVGSFRVADLESANGTFVDGQRIDVASVQHGSLIRTGNTLCVVVETDPVVEFEERLERAAKSAAAVILLGESGTGKELAARRLHERSGRVGPFVPVNAAAFPRELLPSELFGHSRGAFSGAREERAGLFRAADQGTLFLDEIADLPLDLQPVLLRVLEERLVRPVGSERVVPVDVRVVCATHQDLRAQVTNGAFRLDLHARLAEVELRVPSLRERRHTLPALLAALAEAHELGNVSVSTDAMEAIALHEFSQNVRELKSLLGRLKIFGTAPFELDRAFLEREAPHVLSSSSRTTPRKGTPVSVSPPGITRELLLAKLERHGQRVSLVADELQTSRTQVYRWLKRFGIDTPTNRD